MTKLYTRLTQEERYQIHAYKKAEFSNNFIAKELGRHVSTIKRELARNTGLLVICHSKHIILLTIDIC